MSYWIRLITIWLKNPNMLLIKVRKPTNNYIIYTSN